jgi:hypothetical protein
MATTSTLGTARAALKTAMDTGILAGNVYYGHPGPEADKPELVWIHEVVNWTQTIAGIKAGRKQRQEEYTFKVVVWTVHAELDASGGQTAFERGLTVCAVIESALANDVQIGTTAIQYAALEDREIELTPWDKGWACQVILFVKGQARLT